MSGCPQEPVWIITELMENGSLQDYLHKKGQTLVREGNMSVLINMAGQCASGMAYLEAQVGHSLFLYYDYLLGTGIYHIVRTTQYTCLFEWYIYMTGVFELRATLISPLVSLLIQT